MNSFDSDLFLQQKLKICFDYTWNQTGHFLNVSFFGQYEIKRINVNCTYIGHKKPESAQKSAPFVKTDYLTQWFSVGFLGLKVGITQG